MNNEFDENEYYSTDTMDDRVTFGKLVARCKEQFEEGCMGCEFQEFCEKYFTDDPKNFPLR